MRSGNIVLWLAVAALLNAACAEEQTGQSDAPATSSASPKQLPDNRVVAQNNPVVSNAKPTATAETGTTRGAVDLLAEPYRDAKRAAQLPANTAVTIRERRGGWLRVSAQGKSGWARLHQISSGSGPAAGTSTNGVALLKNVGETGRSGSQGVVATTGIRGLSAQELKTAKPDPQAVQQLDGYRADEAAAREFARQANLKTHSVPHLNRE